MKPTKKAVDLTLKTDEALKILGYDKWKPELGDWVFKDGECRLIVGILSSNVIKVRFKYRAVFEEPAGRYIPIFSFEQLVLVLRSLGYDNVESYRSPGEEDVVQIALGWSRFILGRGETYQEAMMKAVIGLAKSKEVR